ncbi:MAG: cyclic nucleotide-binding domain-containing protein [Nocardioidaceae bacterium]
MRRVAAITTRLLGNRGLVRASATFFLFILAEIAVWLAVLVYAYARGGATTAGLVAVAELVPAALLAPIMATLADRRPAQILLVCGLLVQALATVGAALVMLTGGSPYLAYAGAIVASTAVTTTRPAMSALTPALARDAEELGSANVALGWMEQLGIGGAGLVTGVLLSIGSPGLVLAVCAGLLGLACLPVVSLRVPAAAVDGNGDDDDDATAWRDVIDGARVLGSNRHARLIVSLIGALYVVYGALDVLFVVVAQGVLHRGSEWAGYLNTAMGVGGIAAGVLTAALVGRRLVRPILGAAVLISLGVGLTAFSHSVALTALLLACAGAGASVLEVGTRTLLQRTVRADVVGRIFGLVEGLSMVGLGVGSVLVSVLVHLGGPKAALVGVGLLLPFAAVIGGRALFGIDAAARVPVVEIALLRSLPHFANLPAPELEGLARALEPVELPTGAVLLRQGDAGDRFYAIAEGEVTVTIDGRFVREERRGQGFGEIALLRDVPRTATITARTATVLYALDRDVFLTVLTGNAATRRTTEAVARDWEG